MLIKSAGRALLLAIIGYFGVEQGTQAATVVSGVIVSNTTWSLAQSPYQVTADVSVENGATLAIEAGVVISIDTGKNITVTNGELNAHGTVNQPIIFTSTLDTTGGTPAPGDWGKIRFLNGTNDTTTIMEYAQIRYGRGVSVEAASPTFNYLQINQNLGPAINIDLNSSPQGIGNQATGNSLNGISVPAGDLLGNVAWGVKGIPYVVSSGIVSVGVSPVITSVTPSEIQQSQSIDAVISGTRLAGAESIKFDVAGVSATLSSGGSDTSIPVRITASASQPLGNIPFEVQTAAGWVRYANGISAIPLKPTIVVNNITPGNMRRAETKSFQISGSYLLGAQVGVPAGVPAGVGLTLSNLQSTDTQANFNLTASTTATLGSQMVSVTNPTIANGVATTVVSINDALPKINTNTIPSAVIPDGVVRQFSLSLTNADTIDHSFNLSVVDPTIISLSPASLTIPAGAASATFNIAGLKLGYTMLNITSPTLASVSKQIYASNLVNGAVVGPVLSPPVSVDVPYNLSTLLPNGTVVPLASLTVGVDVPYNLSTLLPTGTVVPLASSVVGVDVPFSLTTLPVGTVVGPTLSPPVGVNVP